MLSTHPNDEYAATGHNTHAETLCGLARVDADVIGYSAGLSSAADEGERRGIQGGRGGSRTA
jgi:hypothetical protein